MLKIMLAILVLIVVASAGYGFGVVETAQLLDNPDDEMIRVIQENYCNLYPLTGE